MANGDWQMASGEWRMAIGEHSTHRNSSLLGHLQKQLHFNPAYSRHLNATRAFKEARSGRRPPGGSGSTICRDCVRKMCPRV